MRIACFAKYCMDPANLVIDKATQKIDFERSPKKISESDLNAVEESIKIKSSLVGSTAHIFCVGPTEASKSLRELLGMGADKAYHIADPAYRSMDSRAVAMLLKAAIEKFGPYDLIIAGHASEDTYSGAVALMVAQMLGVQHVAYVTKLEVQKDSVKAERSLEDGVEVVEARLPLLLTVMRDLNTPRYATTLQILRVPRDALTTLKPQDVGLNAEQLVQSAPQRQVDLALLSSARKNVIIDGADAREASKKLIEVLKSEEVI